MKNKNHKVNNYIVGPVNQFERTINSRIQQYPYFRKSNFSDINKFVLTLNKTIIKTYTTRSYTLNTHTKLYRINTE